jgi:phosphoribosylaminoimidazole-succinocarboxamide synthase
MRPSSGGGRFKGEVVLGDEFSPDGSRLWDKNTLDKMDKDRFRQSPLNRPNSSLKSTRIRPASSNSFFSTSLAL